MKLYTEEQVRMLDINTGDITIDEVIDCLTPIELPSDEEVDKENEKVFGRDYIVDMGTNLKWAYREAFEVGAKWVINHIEHQAIT